jgi:Mlc titration factor MtfA (ptsG expression regulator)
VSDYGAKHDREDFAEACGLYVGNPEFLKARFPLKYAALDDIMNRRSN